MVIRAELLRTYICRILIVIRENEGKKIISSESNGLSYIIEPRSLSYSP